MQTTDNEKIIQKRLKKRHRAEKRFKFYGFFSLLIALLFLLFFIGTIIKDAKPAFKQTKVLISFTIKPQDLSARGLSIDNLNKNNPSDLTKLLRGSNYEKVLLRAINQQFKQFVTETDPRKQKKQVIGLYRMILSTGAQYSIRDLLLENADKFTDYLDKPIQLWLESSGDLDALVQNNYQKENPKLLQIKDYLQQKGQIRTEFNTIMFTQSDSRTAQNAGIFGAVKGSFYTLLVTLGLSFPIAVLAAVYLEEFAPKNRFTDFLEANINNLAAVPSIVFGILGLAIFIQLFGLPRSTPIVGGLVLTLMTLPTIIIASRAALKAVPPSIRSAALGLGASKMQVVFHHVLPLALPGMLTGTIIGMAQALGETAPLLMIGMVAFIADPAQGIFDSANVLPVQIYLWSDLPDRAFVARTSFAILFLLVFLILMNLLAVFLRKKFEKKW